MQSEFWKYFLYRHIRPDKNEPFYVGIGTVPKLKSVLGYRTQYMRAYNKASRPKIWQDLVKKIGSYEVEIMLESDNSQEIQNAEKFFIKLYGRKDLKTGILVNRTDGGDGIINPSETNRARMKAAGLAMSSDYDKRKLMHQYDLNGFYIKTWVSITEAANHYNLSGPAALAYACKRPENTIAGFRWSYEKIDRIIVDLNAIVQRKKNCALATRKAVLMMDHHTNEILREFSSTLEAQHELGIANGSISSVCLNKPSCKTAGGYKWAYKNN